MLAEFRESRRPNSGDNPQMNALPATDSLDS